MRELLTRADDFGASPGANDAILAAARAGFIRNVGVMAPAPHLERRLEELRALQDAVCVGVHATVNSEWAQLRWGPVLGAAAVPGLVREDGTFWPSTRETAQHASAEEIRAEVAAQLRRVRALGLEPRYLDTHMGFAWIDGVDAALADLCRREGLVYDGGGQFPKLRLPINEGAPPGPDAVLQQMRQAGQPRAVWIFHPARLDAVSERFYHTHEAPHLDIARQRDRECRVITDPAFIAAFTSCPELRLARYDGSTV